MERERERERERDKRERERERERERSVPKADANGAVLYLFYFGKLMEKRDKNRNEPKQNKQNGPH